MYTQWIRQFPTKKFEKDSYLFLQGDELDYCYYITKGICSKSTSYENGIEVIVKYHFPHDLLNIWGVLKNRTTCSSTVIAKTDVHAIMVPVAVIRKKMSEDFAFYRQIVEPLIEDNQYIYQQYQKKTKGGTAEMLCYSILALSRSSSNDQKHLPKVFSFMDLSQHLRIHRITVSHIFQALQKEQIIRKCKDGWQILNVEALEEYAQGNKTLNY